MMRSCLARGIVPVVIRVGGVSVAAVATERRLENRETSWVDFDARVLELAADPRLELLDRVRLCGIVSSNLDEFFAVRVARLVAGRRTGAPLRAPAAPRRGRRRRPDRTLQPGRAAGRPRPLPA
jgi:hypothetical protein